MELLKNNKRIFPLIGAIIVFILSFSVLYMGDNIGLSDNGDFRRVLLVNNMEYENDSNYYYLFKQDYKMKVEGAGFWDKITYLCESNSEEDIYSSPQFIIIKASKVMNFVANKITSRDETTYNIAYLAFIYILMLSTAAWVIFTFFADEPRKMQIAVFLIFVFIFCDAGYLLQFVVRRTAAICVAYDTYCVGAFDIQTTDYTENSLLFCGTVLFRRFKTCQCAVFGYSFGACTFLCVFA